MDDTESDDGSRAGGPGVPSGGPDAVLRWFRLVLGVATGLMLALSWRLWVGAGDIPRVPFVDGLEDPRAPGVAFGALLAAMILGPALGAVLRGPETRAGRRVVAAVELIAVGLLVRLILADQHRFQPWAYQYIVTTLALATMPAARGLRCARRFLIALYAYSGLSKLDVTFTRELGLLFLSGIVGPFGVDVATISEPWRTAGVLAMPSGELLVALGLAVPATRRIGLIGAVGLHATLIGLLGPWGLGHSTIVLVWNVALLVEVLVLFSPRPEGVTAATPPARVAWIEVPARLIVLAALVMPAFERYGFWDTWPSFALYASHAERVDVAVAAGQEGRYPSSVRARLGPPDGTGSRRLDLNGWSLDQRGTPVYPQGRAMLGLAAALARGGPGGPREVRATILGRADRWTGRRSSQALSGWRSIRLRARRFRLNALPAGVVRDPLTAHEMRREAAARRAA